MTKGQEVTMEIEAKKDIAEKDRKQRDKESRRKMFTDLLKPIKFGKFNDPSWYTKWVNDFAIFTNYPRFNNAKLYTEGLGSIKYNSSTAPVTTIGTTTVMEISYAPMLGISSSVGGYSPSDRFPINVAFARSLSQIRKASGRAAAYNPDVPGLYWLSAIEIGAFLMDMRCALQLALHFQPNNSDIPSRLLGNKGWNYQDITTNRADYLKMYQYYAARFNSNILIPKNLSLATRRLWLPTVILKDANLLRAQYIVFHQGSYGQFKADESGIEFGYGNKTSLATIRSYLETAFQRLEESVTMTAFIADIRAAIPSSNFLQIPSDVDEAPMIVEATHEVLAQIHNIKPLPLSGLVNSGNMSDITSNTTYLSQPNLTFNYQFSGNNSNTQANIIKAINECYSQVIIDSYSNESKPEDLLVMTRLAAVCSADVGASNTVDINIESCGTELVTSVTYERFDSTSGSYSRSTLTLLYLMSGAGISVDVVSAHSNVDWAPMYYGFSFSDSSTYTYQCTLIGEVGNAYAVNKAAMREIHRLCICSEGYLDDATFKASYGKPW